MTLRVLVLSLVYPPDGVSTSQLLGEITDDLASYGAELQVVTTSPHYNVDVTARDQQPIRWRWHRLVGDSQRGSIRVTHVRMPQKAAGKTGRILQWLWFHVGTSMIAAKRRSSYDCIFTVSPPPTVAVVAAALKRIARVPFLYAVWELYPDILLSVGELKKTDRLYRALKRLEKLTYREASHIACLHQPMAAAVVATYPPAQTKTSVLPTFADTEVLRPLARDTPLRAEHGLGDKFVIGYAGNLGAYQDLQTVLDAAAQLREDTNVVFLIAGDGAERPALEKRCQDDKLFNVIFLGHLPFESMPELYATCDVSIVTLAAGLSSEVLPSKTYRIMACGRPILAICGAQSPVADLILRHGCGVVASPDDPKAVADAISVMERDQDWVKSAGSKARDAAVAEYSRARVTRQYFDRLEALVRGSAR